MLQRTATVSSITVTLPRTARESAVRRRASNPETSTSTRHARRRVEIVAAAARVFAERGYHGASTQNIADQLGIRQASLYYYFESKETALEEVCRVGVEGFLESAQTIAAGDATATAQVTQLIAAHLAPLAERGDFVRVFLRERQHLATASRQRIGRISRRYERVIEGVFAVGIKRRELRKDLDVRMMTLALLGMCNAVAPWYGHEPRADIKRIVAAFSALLRDGVRA